VRPFLTLMSHYHTSQHIEVKLVAMHLTALHQCFVCRSEAGSGFVGAAEITMEEAVRKL
jgi:hypothetical protein